MIEQKPLICKYGIIEIRRPGEDCLTNELNAVESNEDRIRNLITEASFTVSTVFVRESQNHHKKYLRDKAQYKFGKDQEFVGNNRAGRRRK